MDVDNKCALESGPILVKYHRKHRKDLQGVRGYAIAVVLLFHLRPDLFRLGFVGVDMFFVLSGFLICGMVRQKESFKDCLLQFYKRRFRRIVPIYYVVLATVFVATSFFVILLDRPQIVNDLKWSIAFVSNMQPIVQKQGYWDIISSYRFFVHTWSLGVELQFYCIAPFLYRMFSGNTSLCFHASIGLCSLLLQLHSAPTVSYGFVFCRMWQFNAGAVVALWNERNDGINGSIANSKIIKPQIVNFSMALLTVVIILNPSAVTETTARLIATLLTALLIFLDMESFLCSHAMNLVGDLSYVIYLIHWPVFVGFKYIYEINLLDLKGCIFCTTLTMLLAIIVHHHIEKRIIESSYVYTLFTVFIAMSAILINYSVYNNDNYIIKFSPQLEYSNQTIVKSAIAFNSIQEVGYYEHPCVTDKEAISWTNFGSEPQLVCIAKGNGTLNVLMVGNSISYRLQPLILDLLTKERPIQQLRLFARSALSPIPSLSLEFTTAARTVVERTKADILIYSAPLMGIDIQNFTSSESMRDRYLKEIQEMVDFYSKHTKVIILETPYYFADKRVARTIVKRLIYNQQLDDLYVAKEDDEKQRSFERSTINRVKCEKCVICEIHKAFFTNDKYLLYDPINLHARTSDGAHLTVDGLHMISDRYRNCLTDAFKRL